MYVKRKALAAAVAVALVGPASADPPANTNLPTVFCWRFTDIERVPGDPEGDRFLFEFEVLNWTTHDAHAVSVGTNVGTSAGVNIVGATVDPNGRGGPNDDDNFGDIPQTSGPDPVPGNPTTDPVFNGAAFGDKDVPNAWGVVEQNSDFVLWGDTTLQEVASDPQQTEPSEIGFTEIVGNLGLPNIDLLFGGNGSIPGRLLPIGEDGYRGPDGTGPGDTTIDGGEGVNDGYGDNVADGFVLDVDGLGVGDVLSLNWNLLGVNSSGGFLEPTSNTNCNVNMIDHSCYGPIFSQSGPNAFGFGTISITRTEAPDGIPGVGPLFENNTGFTQAPFLFFEVNPGDPTSSVARIPNPTGIHGEAAAGQHGEWQGNSNPFQQGNNIVGLLPQATPAPGTVLLTGLGLLAAFGLRRRRQRWS